jgi:hypothetical protein
MALSSNEEKYIASSQASSEAIWICKLFVGLFGHELRPMVIHFDN